MPDVSRSGTQPAACKSCPVTQKVGSAEPGELTALRGQLIDGLLDAGCAAVGVCGVEPLAESRQVIEQRRSAGLDGGMQFVFRNPARSTDPRRAFPSARSAVVATLPYPSDAADAPDEPSARVARYASTELYAQLRVMLGDTRRQLAEAGYRGVVLADDNALVDRAIALRAGLGWLGKNTNLLVPKVGSWVVIGSVLTDAEFEPIAGIELEGSCGHCDSCRPACPTGALVAPGAMDASRCLSWLLQKSGPFPRKYRRALGDRIYGCDDCQEACPPSRTRVSQPAKAEHAAQPGDSAGVLDPADGPGAWVSLKFLLTASDDALMAELGSWYIAERDPRYLRRNALVVAGNSDPGAHTEMLGPLRHWLRCGDEMLVSHAAWAARAIGREELLHEEDVRGLAAVRAELAAPHPDAVTLAVGARRGETGRDAQ